MSTRYATNVVHDHWTRATAIVTCVAWAIIAAAAPAGPWPQILGPDRSGKATAERIVERLPAAGPKLLWQHPVGAGYAGPAVAGGRVIVFHRPNAHVVCEALDAATGRPIWKRSFPTNYTGSIDPDNGPRCVPTIDRGTIYLLGADGALRALALADGSQRWAVNIRQQFKAPEGYFGCGSSPLVDGDRLLVNVGARGAGIVAFSLADGRTLWKATDDAASYSSPVASSRGRHEVIFITRENAVGLDPASGKVRFQIPFGKRGPTVNAANPVVAGDHLFLSSNYGVGARWINLQTAAPSVIWDNDELLSSQYTTSIEHRGVLYGIDGRQDVGVARLRAIDPAAPKVLWTEEGFGTATLILADGKLIIMKTDGTLVLARPSPKAFEPLGSVKLFDATVQALPALSDGRFFARDTSTLKCYSLAR